MSAETEAKEVTEVVLDFKGVKLILPPDLGKADGDVLDAIEDQKLSKALRGLLGEDQWAKFKAEKPTITEYGEVFEQYAKEIGLETAGN